MKKINYSLLLLIILVIACKKDKTKPQNTPLPPVIIIDFSPKQVNVDDEVTITGTGFGDDIAISINGVDATITQKSATEVKFIVPLSNDLNDQKIIVKTQGKTLQTNAPYSCR